jgi:hypothetical protein
MLNVGSSRRRQRSLPKRVTISAALSWRAVRRVDFCNRLMNIRARLRHHIDDLVSLSDREGCGTHQRSRVGFRGRVGSLQPMRATRNRIRSRHGSFQATSGVTRVLHNPHPAISAVEHPRRSSQLSRAMPFPPGRRADWSRPAQGQCQSLDPEIRVHVNQREPRRELSAVPSPNR